MRKHAPLALLILGLSIVFFGLYKIATKQSPISQDDWARSKVYTLQSKQGMCSGVAVKGDSGKDYILTAGHCSPLIDSIGNITAIDEDGQTYTLKVVEEDPYADLMLLESAGERGVKVADEVETHEHIWTMTHGHAMPSHRSDGEALENRPASFPLFQVTTPDQLIACNQVPKQSSVLILNEQGIAVICIMSETALASTAAIQPGSSGGPVFNDKNELAGIVSATDGTFSYFVTLNDIHRFLRAY
jgi:S1-C subfamily serine protease